MKPKHNPIISRSGRALATGVIPLLALTLSASGAIASVGQRGHVIDLPVAARNGFSAILTPTADLSQQAR